MALEDTQKNFGELLRKREKSEMPNENVENLKSETAAMRHTELKRIADFFRKNPLPEEKTEKIAFVSESKKFQDHGAINKDSSRNGKDEGKMKGCIRKLSEEKSTTESGEEPEKPRMSILRKVCFLLSLNGGVLYAAAFLWFIPCRQPFCSQQHDDWTMNMSGVLTTNMRAVQSVGLPSSVVAGYADENGGNLACFAIADGKMKWNITTRNILRNVFCHFDRLYEPKTSGNPACIATGYNYIGAFDTTYGSMLWERNITNPDGETIHRVALAEDSDKRLFIIGISDSYLFVLDSQNGSIVSITPLPCSWTIDVKLAGPWTTYNETQWTLVCEYGDSIEVWTFHQRDLLGPPKEIQANNDVGFSLLFSHESPIAAIDLAGDVTWTQDSLVLSWADMVVMVTAQAPHRLRRIWEVSSWGTLTPAVTNILSGHFTDPNANQIAVVVQDGLNATIHVLDERNGSSIAVTSLGMRSVMSMEKISGGKGETDVIVIESVNKMNSAKNINTSMAEKMPSTRMYFMMQYAGENATYENIVTDDVFASTLIPYSDGAASLLIASRTPDGDTAIKRHVVISPKKEAGCHWNHHRNASTVFLLD